MTRDVAGQLRTLPPELPEAPDRLEQVHRRARRMRRTRLVLVAAATAVVVTVPLVVVAQHSGTHAARPAPASHQLEVIAQACPIPGLTLQALPSSVALTHTADQAEAVVSDAGVAAATTKTLDVLPAMVRDPIAAKLRLGSPTTPRPMWIIRQLVTVAAAPSQPFTRGGNSAAGRSELVGTRVTQLSLVDDATLTQAFDSQMCAPISATRGDVGFGVPDNTRVAATGVIAPAGTGYVLCRTGGVTAAGEGGSVRDPGWGEPICSDQVPLVGEVDAVTKLSGAAREVSGIWSHDTLAVASIGPPRETDLIDLTKPPCPTPAGGWGDVPPSKTPNLDDTAWMHYRAAHPGVITSIALFRPAELSPVLTLASVDPAGTRSALEGDYPRALCVVRSEFTAAQLSIARAEIRHAFEVHLLPGVDSFGGEGVTAQGQPTLGLAALSDRPELHAALPDVPSNLLVIDAWIRQLS